jgi:antitoxin VapB
MPALNIKDPEAHRLAAAIAQETGETMARVVTEALRERFERLPSRFCKASMEELRAIAQRAGGSVRDGYLDHGDSCTGERISARPIIYDRKTLRHRVTRPPLSQ